MVTSQKGKEFLGILNWDVALLHGLSVHIHLVHFPARGLNTIDFICLSACLVVSLGTCIAIQAYSGK